MANRQQGQTRLETQQNREALQQEIAILRVLKHKNAVAMIDSFETQNSTYILMEHCSEGDLKMFIEQFKSGQQAGDKESTLNENDARYVIKQIVEGLNYLGQNLIMHRDIKRDNILVNRIAVRSGDWIQDYEFKLGDMGLAKHIKSEISLNQTFAGTPLAMAPEMVIGEQYDYKADIWSLGTLLFQILTGTHPFTGNNMDELTSNLKKGAYRIPKHINLTVECLDFLDSCLRFDSIKRKDWDSLL